MRAFIDEHLGQNACVAGFDWIFPHGLDGAGGVKRLDNRPLHHRRDGNDGLAQPGQPQRDSPRRRTRGEDEEPLNECQSVAIAVHRYGIVRSPPIKWLTGRRKEIWSNAMSVGLMRYNHRGPRAPARQFPGSGSGLCLDSSDAQVYVYVRARRRLEMSVQMELHKIIISEMQPEQIIVLKEVDGDRKFPIVIGSGEAYAIDRRLKGLVHPRPLTHDLLASVIEGLGGSIDRIEINDLQDHTFYARILIRQNGNVVKIDSRPSDAIALGVATMVPIFVAEHVLADVCRE